MHIPGFLKVTGLFVAFSASAALSGCGSDSKKDDAAVTVDTGVKFDVASPSDTAKSDTATGIDTGSGGTDTAVVKTDGGSDAGRTDGGSDGGSDGGARADGGGSDGGTSDGAVD